MTKRLHRHWEVATPDHFAEIPVPGDLQDFSSSVKAANGATSCNGGRAYEAGRD